MGAPGVEAGDAADPAGLEQHSFNKYLSRHQRSREAPPLAQVPADEAGPSRGAVGCRDREVGRHLLQTLARGRGVPCFTGSTGVGLALQHLHWVTQRRLAGARCPACMLTLPPARANICGQEASSVSMSRAQVSTGYLPSGPSAATLLPGASQGSPGPACRARVLCLHPQQQRGACQAGGGWAPLPEPPRHSCTRTSRLGPLS